MGSAIDPSFPLLDLYASDRAHLQQNIFAGADPKVRTVPPNHSSMWQPAQMGMTWTLSCMVKVCLMTVLKAWRMCVLVAMGVTRSDIITTIFTNPPITVKPIWTYIHWNPLDQPLQHGRSALAPEAPIHMKGMGSLAGNFDLDRDDLQKPFLVLLSGAHDPCKPPLSLSSDDLVCFIFDTLDPP